MNRIAALAGASFVVSFASIASADSATIGVAGPRYSSPPPVVVVRDETPQPQIIEERAEKLPSDPYRSPFRLTVGPAAITTGEGIGPGLFAAVDFGSGIVGFRLSGAWFRGEAPDDAGATLGSRAGLYSGELTLDLHETGPLHMVLGLGLGALNVGKPGVDAWGLSGITRMGFEYALALRDADVRFGAGLTGGLIGPADSAISGANVFAMANATFSIGF